MTGHDELPEDAIRVTLQIADPGLADRLALLLPVVPGLKLVDQGQLADVALVVSTRPPVAVGKSDGDLPTAREREVLGLLVEGASNKLIARRLGISVHTAKFHVRSLTDKLDATGRTRHSQHAAERSHWALSESLNALIPANWTV